MNTFEYLSQLISYLYATTNVYSRAYGSLKDTVLSSTTLVARLIRGIHTGQFKNDNEAANGLYNADTSDQRYLTLRSRCIDVVIRTIGQLYTHADGCSVHTSQVLKCIDQFRTGYILDINGHSELAGYVLQRSLTIATKQRIPSIAHLIHRNLAQKARSSNLNSIAALHVKRSHHFLLDIYNDHICEISHHGHYDDELLNSHASCQQSSFMITEGLIYCRLINGDRHSSLSENIIIDELRTSIAQMLSAPDYHHAFGSTHRLLMLLDQHKQGYMLILKRHYLLVMLEILIRMRDPHMNDFIYHVVDEFPAGTTAWCIAILLSLYRDIQTCSYQRALHRCIELRERKSSFSSSSFCYEYRMLLEAYLWILTSILPASEFGHPDPQSKIPFRESTFLNAMNVLESNKYGSNALIVIAHVFILLIQNKEKEAYRRILNLNVYATRYLKGESEQRLWYCIKALQKVPSFRTRPHMMREAMEPQIACIRRLADLPMKNGFNELVPWDVLLEAYIVWEVERSRSGGM